MAQLTPEWEKKDTICDGGFISDTDGLTKKQKAEKLNRFLKQRNQRHRNGPPTVESVRQEASQILEEFLRRQLEKQSVPYQRPGGHYQRVEEVDILETEDTVDDEDLASSKGAERPFIEREDSLPYADDEERSESLPSNYKHGVRQEANDVFEKLGIHTAKSKSVSPMVPRSQKQWGGGDHTEKAAKRSHIPLPPPPTPNSASDQSVKKSSPSEELDIEDFAPVIPPPPPPTPMSASEQNSSKSTPTSSTRTLDTVKSRSEATSPTVSDHSTPRSGTSKSPSSNKSLSIDQRKLDRQRHRSGSVSSIDTDDSEIEKGRKKSLFRRASERVSKILMIHKVKKDNDSQESREERKKKTKPRRKKRKDKSVHLEDVADMGDEGSAKVMEEKHTHSNTHIRQTTHSGADRPTVLRLEDTVEVTDITDAQKHKKHIEKHKKIKESSDASTSNGGFIGKLKRLTSRSDKKKIHGSKSSSSGFDDKKKGKAYRRGVSVPVPSPHSPHGEGLKEVQTSARGDQQHSTEIISLDHGPGQSEPVEILDAKGNVIDVVAVQEGDDLPRNKSFEMEIESDVRERKIITPDGKVATVKDVDTHRRMIIPTIDIADEVPEIDGLPEGIDEADDGTNREVGDDESEKEVLYEQIAERLAAIGDSYMTKKEMENAMAGVGITGSGESTSTDPDPNVIHKEKLNSLEREIRDGLRSVADDLDKKLAQSAKGAALRIARHATYSTFSTVMQEAVGNEIGTDQLSALFNITGRAVELAGAGGAMAVQIKELSLRYFEDKFAGWVIGQGGWDSMLSDQDLVTTDMELD